MTKYIDSQNLEWTLKLNVGVLETLQEHGIDVESLFSDPNKLADLFLSKPKKICEMLYVILEKQIKDRNITPQEFAESLDRDTLDEATNALLQEVVLFFQRGATAPVIREKVPSLLKEMDQKIVERMRQRFDKTLGSLDTVMNSAESSQSIPEG